MRWHTATVISTLRYINDRAVVGALVAGILVTLSFRRLQAVRSTVSEQVSEPIQVDGERTGSIAGEERRPPNRADAEATGGVIREELPLPNPADAAAGKQAFVLRGALATGLCARLIAAAEEIGFESDDSYFVPQDGRYVQSCRRALLDSECLAGAVFSRVREAIPSRVAGSTCCGLSERLRFLRYVRGEAFAPHVDGPTVRGNGSDSSLFSVIIYLNEGYDGGRTRFVCAERPEEGTVFEPRTGDVLVFSHDLLHESTPVLRGTKYACRTDVMYRRG